MIEADWTPRRRVLALLHKLIFGSEVGALQGCCRLKMKQLSMA
jgi:hypothetical protein